MAARKTTKKKTTKKKTTKRRAPARRRPARKATSLSRRMSKLSISKVAEQEVEYGVKEVLHGSMFGFLIGFIFESLGWWTPAIPLALLHWILIPLTLGIILIDIVRPIYKPIKLISKEEVQYGFRELLLGVLLGFWIGIYILKVISLP